MAIFTIGPDSRFYWDSFDFTGKVKEGSFDISNESLDKTAWGDSTRVHRVGLSAVSISASGNQDFSATGVDVVLKDAVTSDDSIITMAGQGDAIGDVAYSARSMVASYVPLQGAVGDLGVFNVSGMGSGHWFRGRLLHPRGVETDTDEGEAVQSGVAAATQRMFAVLHVFAVSGTSPTLDVIVESDDNSGFTDGSTRMTFAQASAVGSQMLGPIAGPGGSDSYWRAAWTIGGTDTPTFDFAVSFGFGALTS
jgi:hypothetical protein